MPVKQPEFITLKVTDAAGDRTVEVKNVPSDAAWEELTAKLVASINLPPMGPDGRLIEYSPVLTERGRFANPNELVGDTAQDGDRVELLPRTDAG